MNETNEWYTQELQLVVARPNKGLVLRGRSHKGSATEVGGHTGQQGGGWGGVGGGGGGWSSRNSRSVNGQGDHAPRGPGPSWTRGAEGTRPPQSTRSMNTALRQNGEKHNPVLEPRDHHNPHGPWTRHSGRTERNTIPSLSHATTTIHTVREHGTPAERREIQSRP